MLKKYFLIALFIIFVFGNVFLTVGMSASGAEMAKYEKDQAALIDQIEIYKEQLIDKSSLTEVETKAKDLGFIKPQDVIYVAGESAVVAKLP